MDCRAFDVLGLGDGPRTAGQALRFLVEPAARRNCRAVGATATQLEKGIAPEDLLANKYGRDSGLALAVMGR